MWAHHWNVIKSETDNCLFIRSFVQRAVRIFDAKRETRATLVLKTMLPKIKFLALERFLIKKGFDVTV